VKEGEGGPLYGEAGAIRLTIGEGTGEGKGTTVAEVVVVEVVVSGMAVVVSGVEVVVDMGEVVKDVVEIPVSYTSSLFNSIVA
jgi:hypothetical protein